MERWKALFVTYKELILYVFFGGLTTLVNLAGYALLARLLHVDELLSTLIAFVLSVIFAYLTNRKWVFESRASGGKAICYEVATFFGGRIFSGALDLLIMYLFVTCLHYNDLLIKILSNILVIILNFIISKWIVFRKGKSKSR